MRKKMGHLMCVLVFATWSGVRGTEVGDLFDPADPSSTLDLTESPAGLTLLQRGALSLRDAQLKSQFDQELGSMIGTVEKTITKGTPGYLIKVEMYSDEFGTPVIPQGQLIFPVGVGTEPIDALAEFIRAPRVEHVLPSGLRNDSYYLWVTKKGMDRYSASVISRDFRRVLEQGAVKEAEHRNLLAIWKEALPANGLVSVKRAAYWQEIARRYADHLATAEHKRQVAALTQQFEDAQQKFNIAYQAFQETEAELSRRNEFLQALQVASTLAGIVENACRIGSLQSSSGKSASAEGTPTVSLDDTNKQWRLKIKMITTEYNDQGRVIKKQEAELITRDSQLRQLYQGDGVSLPRAQQPLVPQP